MALIKQSASQHSLKYVISEEAGTKTRDELVADCAAGPLRELLRLEPTASWANLNLGSMLSVYITDPNAVPLDGSARFRTVGPTDQFEAFGSGLVELRFHHTIPR